MLGKLWQRITGADDDNQEGVTLIEITIVIVIIGLLASIIGPRVIGNVDKAKVAKARLEIKNFSTALENYAIDVGSYPVTEEGLIALWQAPDNSVNWSGPYVTDPTFNDPWNNPYIFTSPGSHYGYDFDLASYGKDGAEGGESFNADITNWTESENLGP